MQKSKKAKNYLHERALRLVYCDYESTFEDLLKKDKSLTFHHKNIHQLAIEMFKVKNKLSPSFMTDIFKFVGNQNTRSGDKFAGPNVNTVKKGECSLRNFGPIVWNTMLPNELKECKDLINFKHKIKNNFFI